MTLRNLDLAVAPQTEQYRIQPVCLHGAGEPFLSDWNAFAALSSSNPALNQ